MEMEMEISEYYRRLEEEDLKTLCSEYEAKKVMEDMQTTIKEVEKSEYYTSMVQQLRNNHQLRDNILRVLGSRDGTSDDNEKAEEEQQDHLQMVICGLGSIQFSYDSQYQLALAILLRRDFSHWIGGKVVSFDPIVTTIDVQVMKDLGCNDINEQHLKRLLLSDRPTLLFMPFVLYSVTENFLKENWRPSRLNKMVLFTDGFRRLCDEDHVNPRPYLKAILEHTIEYDNAIKTRPWKPFSDLKWHFFNLLTSDDDQLEAMLPQGMEVKEEEAACDYQNKSNMKNYPCEPEYLLKNLMGDRYPSRPAKREWCPPSTGWIKLNFSAAAAWNYKDGGRKVAVGHGGIFHNENNECLLTYYSVPDLLQVVEGDDDDANAQVDLDFINTMALMEGLIFYMDLRYSTTTAMHNRQRLIIEGDSVRIARWASRVVPPPRRWAEIFKQIHDLLSRIDEHVIFHIYKEANSMAIDLANQAATKCLEQILEYKAPSYIMTPYHCDIVYTMGRMEKAYGEEDCCEFKLA